MAITPPTIQKSVYNRIPFMVQNSDNNTLIDDFTAEVMGELYKTFNISEDDMLDELKYNIPQKSLMADLVGIQFLTRRSLINSEGENGVQATGNKQLKRAKAGEAEAEFYNLKASEGTRVLMETKSLIDKLTSDALRKARSMGFILDIAKDGEFVVNVMSKPLEGPMSISWEGC